MRRRKEHQKRQRTHKPMGGTRPTHATYTVGEDGRVVNYKKNEDDPTYVVFAVIKFGFLITVFFFVVLPLALRLGYAIQ